MTKKSNNKKIIRISSYILTVCLTMAILLPLTLGAKYNHGVQTGGVQPITYLSNQPQYLDKGFNESVYNGSIKFVSTQEEDLGLAISPSYSVDPAFYTETINKVYLKGADTIISTGFNIAGTDWNDSTILEASAKAMTVEYENSKNFVLIDSMENAFLLEDDQIVNGNAMINIVFAQQEAGFFAGLAASLYATYSGINLVGMYGGIPMDPLYSWMSGFEQAINWYNYAILGYHLDGSDVDPSKETDDFMELLPENGNSSDKSLYLKEYILNNEQVKLTTGSGNNSNLEVVNYNSSPDDIISSKETFSVDSWFVGGFDQGTLADEIAHFKSAKMIDEVAIIFPIAGALTLTTFSTILASPNTNTKLIGVDSDFSATVPDGQHEYILGSAIKNVDLAAQLGLWYSEIYRQEYINEDDVPNEDWNKSTSALEDPYTNWGYQFVSEYNSETNSEGWWVPKESEENPGSNSLFIGNYDNGGVNFTNSSNTSQINYLENSFNYIIEGKRTDNTPDNFSEFKDLAFKAQNRKIEEYSPTFVPFNDFRHNSVESHHIWSLDSGWVRSI